MRILGAVPMVGARNPPYRARGRRSARVLVCAILDQVCGVQRRPDAVHHAERKKSMNETKRRAARAPEEAPLDALRWRCDRQCFEFETTDDLPDIDEEGEKSLKGDTSLKWDEDDEETEEETTESNERPD